MNAHDRDSRHRMRVVAEPFMLDRLGHTGDGDSLGIAVLRQFMRLLRPRLLSFYQRRNQVLIPAANPTT